MFSKSQIFNRIRNTLKLTSQIDDKIPWKLSKIIRSQIYKIRQKFSQIKVANLKKKHKSQKFTEKTEIL